MRSFGRVGTMVVVLLIGSTSCTSCSSGSAEAARVRQARPLDRSGLVVQVGGEAGAPTPVGPPPGHPLAQVDRDAGVSARLRDGSTVWFFGDTAERDMTGGLRFFEIGSAAWSPPGRPTETQDYLAGDRVASMAQPGSGFPNCPREAPKAGMWPLSAVVREVGSTDEVTVWMSNICLGSNKDAISRGVSVGRWIYDPAHPPVDRPVVVQILNQVLFPTPLYGTAAFRDKDGLAYVYGCDPPARQTVRAQVGPCRVARVDLDRVADPNAYASWDGHEWQSGSDPESLDLASGPDGPSVPPGPFSVVGDVRTGVYVMLYSPWPGYVPFVEVRASLTPQGPWGVPHLVHLQECDDGLTDSLAACYGANLQPQFSSDGRLGLGYYDRLFTENPVRGSYLVTSVPFSARRTAESPPR